MKPKDNPKYYKKIVNLKTLKKILGRRPRKEKVILCHGNFDVVHPGHVRHLTYAKSKADILIVSLTSDRHISKGTYRPHVPENLRALNIAVFEMVDYVIIDKNKTPLNNIEFIKPNFFAKGFEYSSKNMPKATKDEINVLNKYGGKIIFTPGDIVYSSSNILSNELPNIDYEKLYLIMEKNKITFDSLVKSLKNLKKFHVFVLGQVSFPFHIAKLFNIGLVFYGENGELEYAGDPKYIDPANKAEIQKLLIKSA